MKNIIVLIVEDEVMIAQFLEMELEKAGYKICAFAATGEEAISIAKEKNPDVILMDINLRSTMDGIEAAKKIVSYKETPIIFMTGYSETSMYERAQAIKPVAYLKKPIRLHDLQPLIESATH